MPKIKIHHFKKGLITAVALALLLVMVPDSLLAESINQLQRQIETLNQDIDNSEERIKKLRQRGNSLKNHLAILDAEARQLQAEIDITEQEIATTQAEILQKEAELQRTKELIQENVRVLYKQGNPSTLEMLFSSENFTDFISRQEYMDSVKSSLNEAARESVRIKNELEEKEEDLSEKAEQLVYQKNDLSNKQEEQRRLIAETKGQESRYQELVARQKSKLEKLKVEQAAAIARAQSGGDLRFGNTDYPYIHSDCYDEDGNFNGMEKNSPCDQHVDDWHFYYQQCTSYAAWRRYDLGREIPEWGRIVPTNGKHFYDRAIEDKYVVNRTPLKGAIAVDRSGKWGHVMIVEKVNRNNTINISQFNAQLKGEYTEVDNMPANDGDGGGWSNYWFIHDRP